jgi:hypothetical protein
MLGVSWKFYKSDVSGVECLAGDYNSRFFLGFEEFLCSYKNPRLTP